MIKPTDKNDIIVLEWWESIRRRPSMYIGSVGVLGILRVIRDLLDSAQNASASEIVLQDNSISIRIAATPPSIAVRPRSCVPFLLESCSRLPIPADEPPTLALCEVLDENVNPAEFRRDTQVVSTLAIANALASEFRAASICSSIATSFVFSRGRFVRGPESAPTPDANGLAIFFAPDPEIFGDAMPLFHQLAEVARDIACVRQRKLTVLEPARKLRYECNGCAI